MVDIATLDTAEWVVEEVDDDGMNFREFVFISDVTGL